MSLKSTACSFLNADKTGIFSRASIYENNLRSILKDSHVRQWVQNFLRNPLTRCDSRDSGFYFKDETLTPSGTFKFRGASLLLSRLDRKVCGNLVATSTGNHGVSLAVLAKDLGFSLTVCVPENTAREKIERISSLGSKIIVFGKDLSETIVLAREFSMSTESRFISSIDELLAVGHSTLLTEARMQASSINRLYFPIGVGSGIAGQILSNLMAEAPIEIVGVVHQSHPAWMKSFEAQSPRQSRCESSLAPGLRVSKPDEEVFEFVRKHLNDVVMIGDSDLEKAAKKLNVFPANDLTSFASLAAAIKRKDIASNVLVVRC